MLYVSSNQPPWLHHELNLDLQAESGLPEIGSHRVESCVSVETHHAQVELLDDVVEVHFSGLLLVVRGLSMSKLRLGIFAEDLELTWADLLREQIAPQTVATLALGISCVVPAQPVVIGILAFHGNHAAIGQFLFHEEIDG